MPPRAEQLVGASRVGHRSLGDERHNRVHLRVDSLDLRQVCRHHLASGDLLLANSCGKLDRSQGCDLVAGPRLCRRVISVDCQGSS